MSLYNKKRLAGQTFVKSRREDSFDSASSYNPIVGGQDSGHSRNLSLHQFRTQNHVTSSNTCGGEESNEAPSGSRNHDIDTYMQNFFSKRQLAQTCQTPGKVTGSVSRIGEHLKNYVGRVDSEECLKEAIRDVELSLMRQRMCVNVHPYDQKPINKTKTKQYPSLKSPNTMSNTFYGRFPEPVFNDSSDCTSLRPHPRALKSELARSKRTKNFMT